MNRTRTIRAAAAAAAAAVLPAALALSAAPAGAATFACGNTPRCFGLLDGQAQPLEIATSVPVSQVTGDTTLTGLTPSDTRREDWHVGRFGSGSVVVIKFAPGGQRGPLCITATSDVPGSRPQLEPCMIGAAGSSHQLWQRVNVIGHGFRVYRNMADGLVLTIAGNGQVQLRTMGAGNGGQKNLTLSQPG